MIPSKLFVAPLIDSVARKAAGREAAEVTGRRVTAAARTVIEDVVTIEGKAATKAASAVQKLPKIEVEQKLRLMVGAHATIDAPHFSPDGKQVIYAVRNEIKWIPKWFQKLGGLDPAKEPLEHYAIWIAPTDGSAAPRKLKENIMHNVGQPSFARDGKSFVFVERRNAIGFGDSLMEMNVKQMDLETGKITTVWNGKTTFLHPQFSPDGKQIAVYSRLPKGEEGIYLLDAAKPGAKPIRLTTATDKHPMWSQDGKRIYFHSQDGGNAAKAGEEAVERSWLGYVDLTNPKAPKRVMLDVQDAAFTYHKHPVPVPNSTLVLYHALEGPDAKAKIEVLDTATGRRMRVGLDGHSPNHSDLNAFKHPSLSEDGKRLLVVSKSKGKDAADRGIPETWRVYVLDTIESILNAFKGS